MTSIKKDSKIFIAGKNGMVGSACWRILLDNGYNNLIGLSSDDLDLRDQNKTKLFFKKHNPDVIINAAAKVGGIWANNEYPFEFLMDNMLIQNNLISNSLKQDIEKFIFLGSSCIYPKMASQPIKEEYLLTDSLESTNQWYAIAKISGVKLIEAINKQYKKKYVSLMPTNLYGPNDNFDLNTSHVLPALIRKFHESKNDNSNVNLWGSGSPLREFMFVDDLAKAVLLSVENDLPYHLYNVGSGHEISIKDLAYLIQGIIGHTGEIIWDKTKPDGTPRKLMDSSRFESLGFKARVNLKSGIGKTYEWYLKNHT